MKTVFIAIALFACLGSALAVGQHGLSCQEGGSVSCIHGICDGDRCRCDEGYVSDDVFYQCNKWEPIGDGTPASAIVTYSSDSFEPNFHLRGLRETTESTTTGSSFTCDFAPTDCSNHGVCNQDKDACICNDGWVTYDSTTVQCNYEQKSKTAPMVLAIIPATSPFSIQWFLVDKTEMGLLNLFTGGTPGLIAILILFCCVGTCCAAGEGGEERGKGVTLCMYCFTCLYSISMLGWWIYNIVYFVGDPTDGNGVPLN